MSTLHRRDISGTDLNLLARFSRALQVLDNSGLCTFFYLGQVNMLLPVWFLCSTGWKIANYKAFHNDALGLLVPDFRHICHFIREPESRAVDTLYRLSMLAVVPEQRLSLPPRFKMPFSGVQLFHDGITNVAQGYGFVIERRRLEGNFRSEVDNGA